MTAGVRHTAPGAGVSYQLAAGRHLVKAGAADTDGALEIFEVLAPGGPRPPAQAVPWHTVLFVLHGRIAVHLEHDTHELDVGATLTVPAGVRHTFAAGGESARFLAITSGDRAGQYLADLARTVPIDRSVVEMLPRILAVTARHGVELSG